MSKIALITGVTGQDGAYLARLLLKKGYEVHGIRRNSSSHNIKRISDCLTTPQAQEKAQHQLKLYYADLSDSASIIHAVEKIRPDEIYNLGAQSHVKISFGNPEYTTQVDALGSLRILEALRILRIENSTRFYQASTSELYGKVQEVPQSETTPFYPRSPYGVAKLYSYWITKNYREAYNMHASNGILFNHESPMRATSFVTRKITEAAAKIFFGQQECLYLGNLDAVRDWGHARDYVEGMWKILQQDEPDDYVLATNKTTSVRDFVSMAFSFLSIELEFKNKGIDEVGVCKKSGKTLVRIDPYYFRPSEVEYLQGDYKKASEKLNWKPSVKVSDLCKEMLAADIYLAMRKNGRIAPDSPSYDRLVCEPEGFITWFDEVKESIGIANEF